MEIWGDEKCRSEQDHTKIVQLFSKGYEPGEYTDTQMAAGDTIFGDYILTVFFAETAINRMQRELNQKKNLSQNFSMSFKPGKKGKI